ncbi:MAG TPA: hypothetical protein DIT13_07945, partial [Verrucomicrobiales bacterium]|nr:hypothetical protein [Verrucomicrobiales bacterium]
MNYLRSILRFTVPLLILGGCGYAAWWLLAHPPEQEKKSVPAPLVRVEGTVLRKGLYEPRVRSQGTVRPQPPRRIPAAAEDQQGNGEA